MATPAAEACRLLHRQAVAPSRELEAAGVSRTMLAKLATVELYAGLCTRSLPLLIKY